MKLKLNLFALFLISMFLMTSCDDDDNYSPDLVITDAFHQMYPGATHIEWERKGEYYVVEFRHDGKEKDSWFDANGTWLLTETDIPVSQLPQVIKDNIATTEYRDWRIEDVDYIERKDMDPVYVVEMERGDTDIDLVYSEEGVLLKVVNDYNSAYPEVVENRIIQIVNEKYPGARILDIDRERNMIEVDLVNGGIYFEMFLDNQYNWIQTVYEIRWAGTPEIIKTALQRDGYSFNVYEDDIDRIIRPAEGGEITIYRIELDREPTDLIIYYDEAGNQITI